MWLIYLHSLLKYACFGGTGYTNAIEEILWGMSEINQIINPNKTTQHNAITVYLIRNPLVTHICIIELGHHWLW